MGANCRRAKLQHSGRHRAIAGSEDRAIFAYTLINVVGRDVWFFHRLGKRLRLRRNHGCLVRTQRAHDPIIQLQMRPHQFWRHQCHPGVQRQIRIIAALKHFQEA